MDQLPKILQNLPRITETPSLPAGVQKAFESATKSLEAVKQTVQSQKAAIERSIEIEREYARKMEFYENLHNQAADIGKHEG